MKNFFHFLFSLLLQIINEFRNRYRDIKYYLVFGMRLKLDEQQKEYLSILDSEGILIIPNYWESEKCDLVRNQLDDFISKHPEQLWIDDKQSDFRANGFNFKSSQVQEFLDNEFLLFILEKSQRRGPLTYRFTLGSKVIVKKDNLGSGGGWHRDSIWERQVKAMLYLDDVEEENGPFQYIRYSHNSLRTIYHMIKYKFGYYKNRFKDSEIEPLVKSEKNNLETVSGKKGTLVLFNSRAFHRGMPIKKGARYALTNYYFNKDVLDKFKMVEKTK